MKTLNLILCYNCPLECKENPVKRCARSLPLIESKSTYEWPRVTTNDYRWPRVRLHQNRLVMLLFDVIMRSFHEIMVWKKSIQRQICSYENRMKWRYLERTNGKAYLGVPLPIYIQMYLRCNNQTYTQCKWWLCIQEY